MQEAILEYELTVSSVSWYTVYSVRWYTVHDVSWWLLDYRLWDIHQTSHKPLRLAATSHNAKYESSIAVVELSLRTHNQLAACQEFVETLATSMQQLLATPSFAQCRVRNEGLKFPNIYIFLKYSLHFDLPKPLLWFHSDLTVLLLLWTLEQSVKARVPSVFTAATFTSHKSKIAKH